MANNRRSKQWLWIGALAVGVAALLVPISQYFNASTSDGAEERDAAEESTNPTPSKGPALTYPYLQKLPRSYRDLTSLAAGGAAGSWLPDPDPASLWSDKCDLDVVDATNITSTQFEAYYRHKKPLLIRNLVNDWPAVTKWSRKEIINRIQIQTDRSRGDAKGENSGDSGHGKKYVSNLGVGAGSDIVTGGGIGGVGGGNSGPTLSERLHQMRGQHQALKDYVNFNFTANINSGRDVEAKAKAKAEARRRYRVALELTDQFTFDMSFTDSMPALLLDFTVPKLFRKITKIDSSVSKKIRKGWGGAQASPSASAQAVTAAQLESIKAGVLSSQQRHHWWYVLSLGPSRSGLPLHTHGETWLAVLGQSGFKRWLLRPGGAGEGAGSRAVEGGNGEALDGECGDRGGFAFTAAINEAHPLLGVWAWFKNVYPRKNKEETKGETKSETKAEAEKAINKAKEGAGTSTSSSSTRSSTRSSAGFYLECTQAAGEVLYLPESWSHITMNIGEVVAIGGQLSYSAEERRKKAKKALDSCPINFDARKDLALALGHRSMEVVDVDLPRSKDYLKEAVEAFDSALRLRPAHVEAALMQGEVAVAHYQQHQHQHPSMMTMGRRERQAGVEAAVGRVASFYDKHYAKTVVPADEKMIFAPDNSTSASTSTNYDLPAPMLQTMAMLNEGAAAGHADSSDLSYTALALAHTKVGHFFSQSGAYHICVSVLKRAITLSRLADHVAKSADHVNGDGDDDSDGDSDSDSDDDSDGDSDSDSDSDSDGGGDGDGDGDSDSDDAFLPTKTKAETETMLLYSLEPMLLKELGVCVGMGGNLAMAKRLVLRSMSLSPDSHLDPTTVTLLEYIQKKIETSPQRP